MPKTCITCGQKHYAKGYCKLHYKMPSQLDPKPLKRSIERIRKVSVKRSKELSQYSKLCAAFKVVNTLCQAKLPGCTVLTSDVHHKRGKENARLNEVKYFLAVCRNCHDIIELHPTMAKEKGFSIDRIIPV